MNITQCKKIARAMQAAGYWGISLESVIPIEWIRNDSKRYFGKFANQYEEYCWETALESSESIGHCDEIGWVASRVDIKYRGTIHERLSDGSERLIEYGSDSVLAQWREEIGSPAGYIVTEDDCGRVDVEFFDSLSEIEAKWERLSALESSLWSDDDDDPDNDRGIGFANQNETCSRHGATDCTDPECDPLGVMHSEMQSNEIWGGTE